jgi:hypothetical protein
MPPGVIHLIMTGVSLGVAVGVNAMVARVAR